MSRLPFVTVLASATAYSAALALAVGRPVSIDTLRKANRAISSIHSASTTVAALWLIAGSSWPIPDAGPSTPPKNVATKDSAPWLDDSRNPIIAGKSVAGDLLTALETGYLVYDTASMFVEANLKRNGSNPFSAVLKQRPVFLFHHLGLVAALGYLQMYIAAGREKGVWVIVAFLLMNASNPLLHFRWWTKKRTGAVPVQVDIALAVVFACTRFLLVWYVLQQYGKHHGLGPWTALRKQRLQCKIGTSTICAVNAVWWFSLLYGIVRKSAVQIAPAKKLR